MTKKDWGKAVLESLIDMLMLVCIYFRFDLDVFFQSGIPSKVCAGYLFIKWFWVSLIAAIYLSEKEDKIKAN